MSLISKPTTPLRRLSRDKRGNVLMMMGFALIPITMAAGMAVDYSRAARLKTKMDAAADAAALSAVSDAAMSATDKVVCERAARLFNQQAADTRDTAYNRINLILTVGSSTGTAANVTYDGATNSCSNPVSAASSAASRIVSIAYTIDSNNYFGSFFNKQTLPVEGGTQSKVTIAPDVDFYIALDTSPSMALPVTATGIDALVNATAMYSGTQNALAYNGSTPTKSGCAFACHSNKIQNYVSAGGSLGETPQDNAKYAIVKESPARTGTYGGYAITYVDSKNRFVYQNGSGKKFCYQYGKYNHTQTGCNATDWRTDTNIYNPDGSFVDTYWYTRNKGITLRIDEMRRATADLVTTALAEAQVNEAIYRAAIFGFDSQEQFRRIYPVNLESPPVIKIAEKSTAASYAATVAAGDAFKAKALSDDIDIALINDKVGNGCPVAFCSGNNYLFTSFKGLLDGMLGTGYLPATSGLGTRTGVDTPQAWLFIITDGMSDEKSSLVSGLWSQGNDRTRSEITTSGANSHLSKCAAIKARGIKIAILYTEYTAESIASDEDGQRTWVEGRIPYVEPALRSCANPGYFEIVRTNGDISAALQRLLRKAIVKPRIVK